MTFHVIHKTVYSYSKPVSLCYNIARLVPRNTAGQVCKHSVIKIDPFPGIMNEYEDFFGNKVLYFAIQQHHAALMVTVESDIEKTATPGVECMQYDPPWEDIGIELTAKKDLFLEALQYIPETVMTASTPEIRAYALESFSPRRGMFAATMELMQRIYRDFEFRPGFTTVTTPVSELMEKRKGVCQDFAHLAIACIRSLKLPARYISGYLETMPAEGAPKLTGVDASHAWFAVFLPATGWLDFDPTNNLVPGLRHITIGWGRDYSDIAPLTGVLFSSGQHQLSVSVDVIRGE